MVTNTGVFRSLAFAARVHVQLEPNILRLGFRSLLELHDNIVTIAFGQFRFADKRISLLLEFQFRFAFFCVSDNGDGLCRCRNRLHRFVVKVDGDGAVLLNYEFRVRFSLFEELAAFGREKMFMIVLFSGGNSK